ncbi:hypothetical protein CBS147333_9953 [Penicillium roqueforti]|nr:hypothetical protein CBS147333_9953 [Penicillium roqueforti]KAI3189201.1 hypothetical protein CBS147311_9901 [Penicillium roqueforti]KAI3261369.1 hypothetical protein CBS147308_9772 [Penicillium roqueforti]KAI3277999.1 hypothetical protein DTO003C3_9888 [Penicillium roqueforti]
MRCHSNHARERRFSFLSSTIRTVVHAATLEHLESKLGPFHELLGAEAHDDFWWFLDASNPTEEDVAALSEVFAIHPLTAEDMRLRETNEKIDLYPGYSFLSLRLSADSSNLKKPSSNLYALVFSHGALSVSFPESGQELNFDGPIMRLRNHSTLTSRSMCLIIIDAIIRSFDSLISDIQDEIEAIDAVPSGSSPQEIRHYFLQVYQCRKRVIKTSSRLKRKPDILNSLTLCCDRYSSKDPPIELESWIESTRSQIAMMLSKLSHFEQSLSRASLRDYGHILVNPPQTPNQLRRTAMKALVISACLGLIGSISYVLFNCRALRSATEHLGTVGALGVAFLLILLIVMGFTGHVSI